MQSPSRQTLGVAGAGGIAALAASFLLGGLGSAFVIRPVDDFLIDHVPGWLIAAVLAEFGVLGHLFHVVPVVIGVGAAFAGVAFLGLQTALGRESRILGAVLAGVGGTVLAGLLTGHWQNALAPGLALALTVGLSLTGGTEIRPLSVERRSVLRSGAGAATLLGLGGLAQVVLTEPEPPAPLERGRAEATAMQSTAEQQSLDVRGLEGLVSGEHYEVDINPLANPSVNAEDWSLQVTGAVETERSYGYEELLEMSQEHRFNTLRCVSDPLNGYKMDTAVWTGVPTAAILDAAGPRGDCECAMLRAVDGYYVKVPLTPLREGLLAYGMNGRYVPQKHGYPLRALVPGHWGETHGKWLQEIELLEEPMEGYWESPPRNWEGTGVVTTIAKLHVARRISSDRVQLAGHAYAGTRGIDRVEVSIDDGATWMEATLSEPLPGMDTWRQWVLEYAQTGSETAIVRAIDGTGTVQPRERAEPYPRGASGWVETRVP